MAKLIAPEIEVREARRRYWLRKDAVYLADEAITTLVCETRGIEAYRAV